MQPKVWLEPSFLSYVFFGIESSLDPLPLSVGYVAQLQGSISIHGVISNLHEFFWLCGVDVGLIRLPSTVALNYVDRPSRIWFGVNSGNSPHVAVEMSRKNKVNSVLDEDRLQVYPRLCHEDLAGVIVEGRIYWTVQHDY